MGSRRAPLFAGIGVAVVIVAVVLFLVLPKMGEVSDAQTTLDAATSEQQTLESQRNALLDAKDRAPEARATIAEVERLIPPVSDEPGLLLLLNNAAMASGLDVVSFAPSPGTFDETTGLSTIAVSLSGSGTYFDVTEFMYRIETLPRAAKMSTISLAPGGAGEGATTSTSTLSFTGTLSLYTSDTSTGPGSVPGTQSTTQSTGEGA
jgi:Tfp pilus assembly protein PilO